MGHNLEECAMGSVGSSSRETSEHASDPATFPAGIAVRISSTGALSTTKAAGRWAGISLGKSLSDTSKTSVCRTGLRVPVQIESAPARGLVTISSYADLVDTSNDTLKIGATTFTFKTSASLEGEVLCAASGSTNAVVAAALVTKINAHSVAGTLFKATALSNAVTITALNNATLGEDIDLIYTDASPTTIGLTTDDVTFTGGAASADYVTIGAKVYFSDTTGKADDANSGATISSAIYVSEAITGFDESGNAVAAALIDMPKGL